jgi:CDP-6-deoxy-D-xylo-4-hexulose-3-dehydrase
LAFVLTIKPEAPFTRREFQIFMEKRRIQTRTVFTGNILRQPGFKGVAHRAQTGGYPHADDVMKGGVLMACHHGLNAAQRTHLVESAEIFLKGK